MTNPTTHPSRPGFGFARRNGATLVAWHGDVAEVAYRDGVRPETLAELRRYLGAPLQLTHHDVAGFVGHEHAVGRGVEHLPHEIGTETATRLGFRPQRFGVVHPDSPAETASAVGRPT